MGNGMNSLARVLSSLIRQADDSPQAREVAVFTAWNGAVGAGIRRFSEPARLDGRRLIVCTVDQTWKTQLERLAPQFIFKINSFLGAPLVTLITFRIDANWVEQNRESKKPKVPTGDATRYVQQLANDAQAIPNRDLREVFLRAASKCLARVEADPSIPKKE